MSVILSSSSMKLKRTNLDEHLTNLRDRIPLQTNNSCKSEELSFLALLYLIIMQTFSTILLFLYTLINFCTIILSVVKFFLGWLVNLLRTTNRSSILIKSAVILVEFCVLMWIVYKVASIVFVPIIGTQLTVANQLVGRGDTDTDERKGAAWFMGGKDTGDDDDKDDTLEDAPKKMTKENGEMMNEEENNFEENEKVNTVIEEFNPNYNLKDKSLIKINCGAEAFNETHIKKKVIIFKDGMTIDDVRDLCYS